jgi:hypothetical protein
LVIDVELVSGGDRKDFWPRPGRTFVTSRTHTFEQFAGAIDDAFGRWDLSHLHEFALADGTTVGIPDDEFDEDRVIVDSRRLKLGRLTSGEQFAYVFDLGDYWAHLCTVGSETSRSRRGLRHRAGPTRGHLRLGRLPRPVRPAVGRRRRFQPPASEPEGSRPPADPSRMAALYLNVGSRSRPSRTG